MINEATSAIREFYAAYNTTNKTTPLADDAPPTDRVNRCKAYIEKIPDAISGNGGHNATLRAACECFRFALTYIQAVLVMRWFNEQKTGGEQWTEDELRHKLDSAKQIVDDANEFGIRLSLDYKWTDIGNAEQFADHHRDKLRWNATSKTWLVFTGTRWKPDETGEVMQLAKRTIRQRYQAASYIEDGDKKRDYLKWVMQCENVKRLTPMLHWAKTEPGIAVTENELDADDWVVGMESGPVCLRTGTLLPNDGSRLITKTMNVPFNQYAKAPLWAEFIKQITNNSDDLAWYLQKLLGSFMTGDIGEQYLPIFHGSGANGKSALVDTLLDIFGDYGGPAPDSLITDSHNSEHPTELADLKGLRLVVGSETEEGKKLRVNLMKKLTGDKFIKGRFMRCDFFKFRRTHKTILVTNNLPRVRESKNAIWRRIRLVPFSVTIPPDRQDKQLVTKLLEERAGIFNWLLEGCLAWQKEGLGEPAVVTQATAEYQEHEDALRDFILERCVVDADAEATRSDLWRAYEQWARDVDEKRTFGRNTFYRRIESHPGVSIGNVGRGNSQIRGFHGIGVRCKAVDDAADEDPRLNRESAA